MSEAIDETLWERLETEFTLPALEQVQARLAALHNDPEPLIRQLVRVFTCPAHLGSLIRRLSTPFAGVTHHSAVPW